MNRWLRRLLPVTVVTRATLLILFQALLVGALFAAAATGLLQRTEHQRQTAELKTLLATVQSTVSIACFVKDAALAREIADGLLHNSAVVAVRIRADGDTLHAAGATGPEASSAERLWIARPVYSPFQPEQVVGRIEIAASRPVLQARARSYALVVLVTLGLLVLLVGLAVAMVVYLLITRPIRSISDELHGLMAKAGMRLHKPRYHEADEIGRLVEDVNHLIGEMSSLIAAEHRMRLEREASERRLSLIFEKVEAGIFEFQREGRLENWNPAFEHTLGTPGEPPMLWPLVGDHAAAVRELAAASLASGQTQELELQIPSAEGATRWFDLSLTPVGDVRLQGVINDITDHKRAEFAAQQMAERDTLTGLLNRRGLDAGLSAAFEQRENEPRMAVVVMMIDLDRFKQVNDTYGHAAGDRVLVHVAGILRHEVRSGDLVARPGGDEFEVVLIGIEDMSRAQAIAQSIIDRVRQPIDIDEEHQVQIGASIGLALATADERDAGPALERADQALYAVKHAGRGQVRVAPAPVREPGMPGAVH